MEIDVQRRHFEYKFVFNLERKKKTMINFR